MDGGGDAPGRRAWDLRLSGWLPTALFTGSAAQRQFRFPNLPATPTTDAWFTRRRLRATFATFAVTPFSWALVTALQVVPSLLRLQLPHILLVYSCWFNTLLPHVYATNPRPSARLPQLLHTHRLWCGTPRCRLCPMYITVGPVPRYPHPPPLYRCPFLCNIPTVLHVTTYLHPWLGWFNQLTMCVRTVPPPSRCIAAPYLRCGTIYRSVVSWTFCCSLPALVHPHYPAHPHGCSAPATGGSRAHPLLPRLFWNDAHPPAAFAHPALPAPTWLFTFWLRFCLKFT